MIDAVYIVGTGTGWRNNELRFSLRSLQTHVSGVRNVYIVGHCPEFIQNVRHIPFNDRFTCKEKNIMLKMAHVCGHPHLSNNFLHLHDDHFALQPQDAENVPFWASSSLEKTARSTNPKNHWQHAVVNTARVLNEKGLQTRNFDLHYPMIINKNIFPEIMDRYNWKEQRGYVVKSLYANTAGLEPTFTFDLKINSTLSLSDVVKKLKFRPWFSLGNGGLSPQMKELLSFLYPQPSQYEKPINLNRGI